MAVKSREFDEQTWQTIQHDIGEHKAHDRQGPKD